MLTTTETVGTPEQEKLIMLMAGIIEQYFRKNNGNHTGTDYLQIMGSGRKSMKRILPAPYKEIKSFPVTEKQSLLKEILQDLISYYNLHEWNNEILDTCMILYTEWTNEYRK